MKKHFLIVVVALLLSTGLALGGQLWASGHFRAAQRALASRDFARAHHHLSLCAKVWFRGAETHLLLARTSRLAGEYDRAESYLRACRELGVPPETLLLEGLLLRAQQGDLATVEGYLVSRVLQDHPEKVLILEVLTPAYLGNYRLHETLACVKCWLEQEPDRLQAWVYRAQVASLLKNSDETVVSYQRIVELDPDNLDARLTLAGLLADARGPEEAVVHFEHVRQRQGNNPAILTGLARCRRVLGQAQEARRLLETVLAAQPDYWAALSERAQLALDTESAAEAETWFRRAVAQKPFEKELLYGLYQCLVRLGKHPEAEEVQARLRCVEADLERISALTRRIASEPHNPDLRAEAGTILVRNGQAIEGLRWLASALQADPQHQATHRALADYYERTGEPAQAASHRQLALQRGGTLAPPAPTQTAP
jgi:tetratricopeptide (TPR) repeat protein